MKIGYLQNQIVELGKEKGFVTNIDVKMFYQSREIEREMNKLVALGYFEKGVDCITFIKWKLKRGDENGKRKK